ncbi:MAG TPA: MarR family transcriptional regulator [Nocardioidaceae bacterium]|jgi:DNA-binding MarR family transcriptional regulator|nr:MarR family transcriptional regulator [Nocardioidaceae bacterium]
MPAEPARSARADTAVASTLAVSVMRLARRLRQERDTDLTATQLSALGSIRRHGPLTIGALAAHERVQPPSMTRTVSCLLELGMVTRTPHPTDGRQVIVVLSDDGLALLETERKRRDAWLGQRLRELDAEDRDVLRRAVPLLEGLAQA